MDFGSLLPFAIITPEGVRRRQRPLSMDSSHYAPSAISQNEDHTKSSASARSARHPAYLQGPPDDLKGVFTRKFRWGTIDVLDPHHCDFAALRTAILSTHIKVLKLHTKEVLYERYRTEKLLARRATQNISDDDKKRFIKDLGL